MNACDVWTSHYRSRDPDRLDITRAGCDRLLRENKPAPGVILAPSAKLVFPALRAMKAARSEDERAAIWLDYRRAYLAEIGRNVACGIGPGRLAALLSRQRLVLCLFLHRPAEVPSFACGRLLGGARRGISRGVGAVSRSQRVEKALSRRIADLEEELALERADHEETRKLARSLIFTQEQPLRCRSCDGLCEEDRRCYAHPTCHACLPPPPPLEVLVIGEREVSS